MNEPIGVGDMVEYVGCPGRPLVLPVGSTDTVMAIKTWETVSRCPFGSGCDGVSIWLKDRPSLLGWCARVWRPVSRRGDFEVFLERLRSDAPDEAEVSAPVRVGEPA